MMYPQVKVNARQFLTRKEENPVPMRTMVGYVEKETNKAVYVHLHGQPEPSTTCIHCGKTLTHPISVILGIGPVCSGLNYNVDMAETEIDSTFQAIREKLESITWVGWLPKSQVKIIETGEYEVVESTKWQIKFLYHGKVYQVVTDNPGKKEEIKSKAEKVEIIPVA